MMITANSTTHVAARKEMPQWEKERFSLFTFHSFSTTYFLLSFHAFMRAFHGSMSSKST